jgi:hypothetical protein
VWPEGLGKLKVFIHLVGSRTHELPARNIVIDSILLEAVSVRMGNLALFSVLSKFVSNGGPAFIDRRTSVLYKRNTKLSIRITTLPCSPLRVTRRFGVIYRLQLQWQRISQARNQLEANNKHVSASCGILGCFIFRP